MLSLLSYRKPDHSDSEDEGDEPMVPEPIMARSAPPAPSIQTRFDALSVDTIDFADGPVPYAAPMMITNDLRPDEEIGLTENGKGGGGGPKRNGVVPKIIKSGTRANAISDKQKAENVFAANKSVAEGMMDIALLTSNANQLKFLLSYNTKSKTFYVNVTLIAISLMLQVAVGVSLIVKKNLKGRRYSRATHYINQFVVIGIFLVTVINVFVAAFTTADT